MWRRARRSRSCWRLIVETLGAGPRAGRRPRQLLRAGRPLPAGHAVDRRCARRSGRAAAARPVRARRPWRGSPRPWPAAERRRAFGRRARWLARLREPGEPLPGLFRPAAALVPRPPRAGQSGLQHPRQPAPRRPAGRRRPGRALAELVRRHEVLRTVRSRRDGEPLPGDPPGGPWLPVPDLSLAALPEEPRRGGGGGGIRPGSGLRPR